MSGRWLTKGSKERQCLNTQTDISLDCFPPTLDVQQSSIRLQMTTNTIYISGNSLHTESARSCIIMQLLLNQDQIMACPWPLDCKPNMSCCHAFSTTSSCAHAYILRSVTLAVLVYLCRWMFHHSSEIIKPGVTDQHGFVRVEFIQMNKNCIFWLTSSWVKCYLDLTEVCGVPLELLSTEEIVPLKTLEVSEHSPVLPLII